MRFLACVVVSVVSSGCAFTFDLAGGPRREAVAISERKLESELEARVSESPRAMSTLRGVQTRKRVGTVLTWTGLGSLVPCLGLSAVSSVSKDAGSLLVPLLSVCAVSIAINLVAVFVNPWPTTWGSVLRSYNEDFPETPWSSDSMGVPRAATTSP
ncbi:MAG: hypothetical protein QM817_34730 [Archangium sp.]